jgi:hypothetical protein
MSALSGGLVGSRPGPRQSIQWVWGSGLGTDLASNVQGTLMMLGPASGGPEFFAEAAHLKTGTT